MLVLTILFVLREGTRNIGFMNINSSSVSKHRVSRKALDLQTMAFFRNKIYAIRDGLLYDKSPVL
jgi:hypothetical protein